MEQVTLTVSDDGYGLVTLNRSDKMNAVTKQMADELLNALEQAKNIEHIKCLVIRGAGDRAFCAGGDLTELHGDLTSEQAYRTLLPMKQVLHELACFPVPTFAFLNGQARGGGCEIATACDFRYGLADGSYGFIQGQLGITPGWGGGEILYKRIPSNIAAHWLMEAQMYSASRALEIGWLHKIVTRQQMDGKELLRPFLEKSVEQLHVFKQQYIEKLSIEGLSQHMDQEVQHCAGLWESEAHVKAVRRFAASSRKNS
ncbi:enoyl-CoA hydratase/isomerase family protein [Halobacillus ihumii]|uniref:enoyl-CoA hydratase/isomerase family protein n=1 Tax=Halobacillus ihumii TaxID=2686092 RepID=UPI0013D309C6|nr:enoyl-CoA hydratase/isomerase family protein [Halobacillus ihumii]